MSMQQKTARPKADSMSVSRRASAKPRLAGPVNVVPSAVRSVETQSARFGHDLSDVRLYPDISALARMSPRSDMADHLSQPGDESEREADRVADDVMAGENAKPKIMAHPAPIQRMLASPEVESFLSNSWLGQVGSEAASGIGGALSGAEGWLGGKADQAMSGVTGAAQSGMGWLGNTANEAMSGGISPSWALGKMGEAAGGLS